MIEQWRLKSVHITRIVNKNRGRVEEDICKSLCFHAGSAKHLKTLKWRMGVVEGCTHKCFQEDFVCTVGVSKNNNDHLKLVQVLLTSGI